MRQRHPLRDGWYVRELPGEEHDPVALSAEAAEVLRGGRPTSGAWLRATMPAQVHDVLLAHGRLDDPHVGRNAEGHAWVAERDWAYACAFPTPEGGGGPVTLRFLGLDTLASVYLNGEHLGNYHNMFREHAADVTHRLAPAPQRNVLLIVFRSVVRHLQRLDGSPAGRGTVPGARHLRKAPGDVGPSADARIDYVKVGVYRDVVLDIADGVWIEDVWVRTALSPDHRRAAVHVQVNTSRREGWLHWTLSDADGATVARGDAEASQQAFRIDLDCPRLWWPRGHGEPYLYTLRVELTHGGIRRDLRIVPAGMRTVALQTRDPATLTPVWRFLVNDTPVFLRGAGWAPAEGMSDAWQASRAERLLDLAQSAHMNVLRVRGAAGLPADDGFYDACDRRGLLLWQEFPFGGGAYPDDDAFLAEARAEAEGIVRRLRNHPSVLVWVGRSEAPIGEDATHDTAGTAGSRLFGKVLPEACMALDPTRPYHPCTPHGGPRPNWPLEGDWHDDTATAFSHWSSVPLFASELGRASAPSVESMRRFMGDEELWPSGHDPAIRAPGQAAWPSAWERRSARGAWERAGPLERYPDSASARDLVRVLGTAHGEYLRERVERGRRGRPDGVPLDGRRCWGTLVARLNDPWPAIGSSVVDYYLEPKIAYYYLRRAYAPVLLSFEQTPDELHVWVVNDSPEPVRGEMRVRRMRFDGTVAAVVLQEVDVAPGQSRRSVDTAVLGPISLRHEFLLADLGGMRAIHLLAAERYLVLPEAHVQARVAAGVLVLSTDAFARQVVLEMAGVVGAVFEDNYLDLAPGEVRRVGIVDRAGGRQVTVRCVNAETQMVVL